MPEVHVTTNSIAVIAIVGLMGFAAVLAFVVAFRVRVPAVPTAEDPTELPAAADSQKVEPAPYREPPAYVASVPAVAAAPTVAPVPPTVAAPPTPPPPATTVAPWSTLPPRPELDEPPSR